MSDISLARYEFKKQLERIQNLSGRATELISLYIPSSRPIHEVSAYLRNEYSQSSNIKSKSTRKNVTAAIESINSRLKSFKKPPDNGMVFFVGHVSASGDQTSMVQEIIIPPEEIVTFLYRCDNHFYLEPLEEMLEIKEQYGLLVIDRSEAALGLLRGSRILPLRHMHSQVPSKHGKGGQSKRRFERLIEEAAHNWYKKVAEAALECFPPGGIKGLLVGGPGATKNYFLDAEFLNHEQRKIVLDSFDTGYTNETGLRELVNAAGQMLSQVQLMQEKKLMDQFLKEVLSPKGGLATYGEAQVRQALELGAVDKLLISETLGERPAHDTGGDGDASERDMVQELAELAAATSSDVTLISADSEEGATLRNAFGGLAAILRYPIG